MEQATQYSSQHDARRSRPAVDAKTALIGALIAVAAGLVGWILSDARVDTARGLSAAGTSGFAFGEGRSSNQPSVPPTASVVPQLIMVFNVTPDGDPTTDDIGRKIATQDPPPASEPPQESGAATRSVLQPRDNPVTIVKYETLTTQMLSRMWLHVVAMDGSIVFLGPDGQLTANTGDATGSGIVALASDGSTLESSPSQASQLDWSSASATTDSSATAVSTLVGRMMLQEEAMSGSAPKDVDIEGFEDHSVNVVGNGQVATNDDSNVFINRNGLINANTGDTDSSGLIAVDVAESVIKSGPSGGDEDDQGEESDEEAEEEPEAPDDDTRDAEDTAASMATSGASSGVTPATSGAGSLTIGGDGFDDVSMHAEGNGNVVTADDSNIVIGGTGQVNAQVGDSDTGGVIVMGVRGSEVAAGCAGDGKSCGAG